MAPPVPPPPKGKFGRQKVLLAGAGLVLVVFLFMRSRSSATQTPVDPNAPQTVAQPATFADNGAQAASLGDAVTQGLGDVATSLGGEQTAFQSLADALTANAGDTPATPTTPSSTVGTGAATPPGKVVMTPAPSSPTIQFTPTNAPPPSTPTPTPKPPPDRSINKSSVVHGKPMMLHKIAGQKAPHH